LAGLGLCLIGAAVSGYLTIEHGRGASPICAFGKGCEIVAQSAYASVGRIPTSAFGLLMYLTVGVLYLVRLVAAPPARVDWAFRLAVLVLVFIGAGMSAWLTYVELYVIHAVCIWCVTSVIVVGLLLALAVPDLLIARRPSPEPRGPVSGGVP
jgi:uncharacterized membrane protein